MVHKAIVCAQSSFFKKAERFPVAEVHQPVRVAMHIY